MGTGELETRVQNENYFSVSSVINIIEKYSGWHSFKQRVNWDKIGADKWIITPFIPGLLILNGIASVVESSYKERIGIQD